jgi:hypothetical protein
MGRPVDPTEFSRWQVPFAEEYYDQWVYETEAEATAADVNCSTLREQVTS